ncbi:MAG TPA: enoyl-CoA hydratase/isomerase family protein [Geminicoccaceae bacterium]|nr:enoyl-CoA hydratase/isomerase family protein [Geminicoccaceae bacterium]
MSTARILVERSALAGGGVLVTLTLNRPDKLNAIDSPMLDALEAALAGIEGDGEVRAAVLTGAGRAFCAGADINEWTALDPLTFSRVWGQRGHALFDRTAALRPPVIAAVNGIAFGGGLELALCADIRIASTAARLGLPEVTIGTIPGWGGTQRLPRLIGAGRAKHMIFSGQPVDAARAEAWGLVSEVLGPENLLERAQDLARTIAANAPIAVQAAKRVVDAGLPTSAATVLEGDAGVMCGQTDDFREGRASFLERRPPHYRGR